MRPNDITKMVEHYNSSVFKTNYINEHIQYFEFDNHIVLKVNGLNMFMTKEDWERVIND